MTVMNLEGVTAYVEYMKRKIEERDWHAVSDAANDLRELEAFERGKEAARKASEPYGQ